MNNTRGEDWAVADERFFAEAEREPARAAVLWGEAGRWSYGEVADQALRLGALLKDQGVRPGEGVAVSLAKGPSQVVAVLGVLSAGCVYVPVGPEQPASGGSGFSRCRHRRRGGCRHARTCAQLRAAAARGEGEQRVAGIHHLHVRLDG